MCGRTESSSAGPVGSDEDIIAVADPRMTDSNGKSNNYVGKRKAPVRPTEPDADVMDVDRIESDLDDDNVSEYSFGPDDYARSDEFELDDDDEDARSHITLSDDEAEVPPIPEHVEWRDLTCDGRRQWERIFGHLQHQAINGSWTFTENYQRHVDEQCMDYLSVYNFDDWETPHQEARMIVQRVLDRVRMRNTYGKVFGPHLNQPGAYTSRPPLVPHHQSQSSHPIPGYPGANHHMSVHHIGVHPGANPSQHQRQQMSFSQPHPYHTGPLPAGMQPGIPFRGPSYYTPGQMPPQALQPLRSNMGPQQGAPVKIAARKPKANVVDPVPVPLKAPTPPYPTRDRPDQRKTVGKASRGKTRRQAEADEFPWNRQFDFPAAKIASLSPDYWDDSVYDKAMLDEMDATRVRNKPVVAVLEDDITAKQKVARKKKNPPTKAEVSSEAESDGKSDDAESEGPDNGCRNKGGRKKSRVPGEAGNDPYHSGNFAFAGSADVQRASTIGFRSVDDLIAAGVNDEISLDELFRIKICWSPGKKGNSQDLEQVKFSARDTVNTRKMLARTPLLTHRAGECIIDFCPDLLWRDILLRILSEAGFSNKDIRDRFCLNGSFSDRATIAKRLSAALGKDTNPPKGEGKQAAVEWCESNRDDFDKYQAYFGKRPPARRTAQGRKNSKLITGKGGDSEDNSSPLKPTDQGESSKKKKASAMALDGAADEEPSAVDESDEDDDDDAVSLQDSEDLDAMSD